MKPNQSCVDVKTANNSSPLPRCLSMRSRSERGHHVTARERQKWFYFPVSLVQFLYLIGSCEIEWKPPLWLLAIIPRDLVENRDDLCLVRWKDRWMLSVQLIEELGVCFLCGLSQTYVFIRACGSPETGTTSHTGRSPRMVLSWISVQLGMPLSQSWELLHSWVLWSEHCEVNRAGSSSSIWREQHPAAVLSSWQKYKSVPEKFHWQKCNKSCRWLQHWCKYTNSYWIILNRAACTVMPADTPIPTQYWIAQITRKCREILRFPWQSHRSHMNANWEADSFVTLNKTNHT